MDYMQERFFGNYPLIMGRGVIGTSRLNVYDLIQDIDWASVFDTGYALDYSSSSANDDKTAGTGARKVKVYGLDAKGNQLIEEVQLTGQTKVTGTALFWRVFGAIVALTGTGRKNDGDIYILKTGTGGVLVAGVPPTLTSAAIKILAGENLGTSGMWTAPLGTVYTLDHFIPSCRAQAGRIEIVHGGASIYPQDSISFDIGVGGPASLPFNLPIVSINQLEDVYCRATMAAAGGIVSFAAQLRKVSPRNPGARW